MALISLVASSLGTFCDTNHSTRQFEYRRQIVQFPVLLSTEHKFSNAPSVHDATLSSRFRSASKSGAKVRLERALSCSNRKSKGDCSNFPSCSRSTLSECDMHNGIRFETPICEVPFCARLSVLQHIPSDGQNVNVKTFNSKRRFNSRYLPLMAGEWWVLENLIEFWLMQAQLYLPVGS